PKTLGGETAAINDLVCKLERSAPVQAVALLGMSAWRDKLVEANALFSSLMKLPLGNSEFSCTFAGK
ncbi:MAG: DUF6261 family protein, partial [Bacteroidales bacterium]|nr:DUF6261 family protein [Bacteroidales bacterium]